MYRKQCTPRLRRLFQMFFCPVVLFVLALALCSLSSSHPSRFFGTPEPGWAITPAISLLTQKVLAEWGIHGSAVGVVRLTDTGQVETDLGSWGIMSEDGKLVSVDVSVPFYHPFPLKRRRATRSEASCSQHQDTRHCSRRPVQQSSQALISRLIQEIFCELSYS